MLHCSSVKEGLQSWCGSRRAVGACEASSTNQGLRRGGRGLPQLHLRFHSLVFWFYRQPKPDPTPLVTARYNVFQNDEFDVFSRDSVDVSRIQKGKR